MKFEYLSKPGWIGKMWLRNRMIMPAMETWTATQDGSATDATVAHYARRANGGVGLIITEMTNPTPGCVTFPGELDISEDRFMPGMSRVADAIHAGGAKACLQLCHGGVFAHGGTSSEPAFTPSGIGTTTLPGETLKVMTKADIDKVVDDFGRAALRAKAIGFDSVELHCGHGYLQVEFLSPFYNKRTDEYGGSVYNRLRFSLEIIAKIQEYCGKDFPILFKLSAEDYVEDGITLEQSIEICKYLEEAGVAAVTISGGTLDSRWQDYEDVMTGKKEIDEEKMHLTRGIVNSCWIPSVYCPRGMYTKNAAEIKKHVNMPVITIGAVTPEMAEEMIGKGEADYAAIGRQIFADPDYPQKVMENRIEDMRQCLRCNECQGAGNKNRTLHCAVNPNLGNDGQIETIIFPARKKKRVAIVGSGPAGLNAAISAAERGHEVTLYEKQNRLGGLMHYVAAPEFKSDYQKYTDYLIRTVKKLGVRILLNTEFTEKTAASEQYDKILVATGSELLVPKIEGMDGEGILTPWQVLDNEYPDAEHFLVCGAGLVGCEVAMHLAEHGKKVTMIDIVPNLAPANLYGVDFSLNAKLMADHVDIQLNKRIKKVTPTEVTAETKKVNPPLNLNTGKGTEKPYDLSGPYDGGDQVFRGDAVVCALGMRPVSGLLNTLAQKGYPIEAIGDCMGARKILDAVHEGYHAGRRI